MTIITLDKIVIAFVLTIMVAPTSAQELRRAPSDQFEYRPGLQGFRPTTQTGIASVYSYGPTASGERYSRNAMAAAHRTLPFGTRVKVTHQKTGRSVVVRIFDRGPYIKGRIIDLTPAAARAIGFSGLALVTISVVN